MKKLCSVIPLLNIYSCLLFYARIILSSAPIPQPQCNWYIPVSVHARHRDLSILSSDIKLALTARESCISASQDCFQGPTPDSDRSGED